jgi:hypothetical protein
MGKRPIRATKIVMKLVATAVTFAVFAFGVDGQGTRVASPLPTPSTTVVPVTTTIAVPPSTTVAITSTTLSMRKVPHVIATVVEPWISLPTIRFTLTAYVPKTELEQLICDSKWEWDCQEAIAVATCESNMKPNAVSRPNTNGTTDRGLFQINDVWRDAWPPNVWARILDPHVNIMMAHHAWKVGKRSWMYWTCQP